MTDRRLTLTIEKPAVGGRMLARLDGRVVLVAGAIPGERVVARVERVKGDVTFAVVEDVLDASPHRRSGHPDPACGGMTFSHIAEQAQRDIKAEIVRDAFARIGKMSLEVLAVRASPARAYRMRARVHVRNGRLGSFREGTHDVCDVAVTGQLRDDTLGILREIEVACSRSGIARIEAIEVAENLDATERVLHIEPSAGTPLPDEWLGHLGQLPGVTGVTVAGPARRVRLASGVPVVGDLLSVYAGVPVAGRLERQARSFFQANRFLTPALAQAVVARLVRPRAIDLYAGVGLFALAAAAAAGVEVTAVEGDAASADDLARNAHLAGPPVRVVHAAVEDYVRHTRGVGDAAVIVDPPRTGMSNRALDGVMSWRAPQLVYVSCDVATAARDARRLVDAGYRASPAELFDMFPNTPHVETVVSFTRS